MMNIIGNSKNIFTGRFTTMFKNFTKTDPRDAVIITTIIGISMIPVYLGVSIYKDSDKSNGSYWERLKEEYSNSDW